MEYAVLDVTRDLNGVLVLIFAGRDRDDVVLDPLRWRVGIFDTKNWIVRQEDEALRFRLDRSKDVRGRAVADFSELRAHPEQIHMAPGLS